MALFSWDGCWAGPRVYLLPWGGGAGQGWYLRWVSQSPYQRHSWLGLCLSHTQKHFSILPSLKAVLIQSFSPAHPIYNSLVLARVEQTGESGTLQAPSPLVSREAVSVGAGSRPSSSLGVARLR